LVATPLSSMLFKIEDNDGTYLGIHTPIPSQGHGLKNLSFTTTKEALIIFPGRIETWRAERVIELNHTFLILGPWIEARQLLPWTSLERSEKIRRLMTLARCYSQLEDTVGPHYEGPLGGFSLFFLENEGVLVLPELWSRTILHNLSDVEQQVFRYLTEPPAIGKSTKPNFAVRYGYLLGSLVYETLTTEFPFHLSSTTVDDLMEISQQKKAQLFKPMGLYLAGLPSNLEKLIEALLKKGTKDHIALLGTLEADLSRPYSPASSDRSPENERSRKKLESRWKLASGWFRWREKVRKNRSALLAGLVGAIFVISLGNTILTRVLSPPPSVGWEPETVVEEFYAAATNLDAELLDRLVLDGAAKEFRQMVVQLFATARVRQAYEMRDPVLTPEEWEAQGRSGLEDSIIVFGIENLQILEINPQGEELEVRVQYDFYVPDFPEDGPGEGMEATPPGPGVEISRVREVLTLRRSRDAWLISSILPD